MNFETFDKVKELCRKRNISLSKLEKTLEFSPNSLYSWKKASPSIEKLVVVANYFNVSLEYLLGLNEYDSNENTFNFENLLQRNISYKNIVLSDEEKEILLTVSFALLNSTFKVNNIDSLPLTEQNIFKPKKENLIINELVIADSETIQSYIVDVHIEIEKKYLPKKFNSIAKVTGNSFEPFMKDNEILFIENKDEILPNNIGVFEIDNISYIKKIRREYNGDFYLQSLNNKSEDIYFSDNEIKIVGEVVGSYLEKEKKQE